VEVLGRINQLPKSPKLPKIDQNLCMRPVSLSRGVHNAWPVFRSRAMSAMTHVHGNSRSVFTVDQ